MREDKSEPELHMPAEARLSGRLGRLPRWLSPLMGLLLFAGAVWVIHRELEVHSLKEIGASLQSAPPSVILTTLGLCALSFLLLALIERSALQMLRRERSLISVLRPSFVSCALSNAIGFSFATAPAVRARLYRETLKPAEIAALSAVSGMSVNAGGATAAGLSLIIGANEVAAQGFGAAWMWLLLGFVLLIPAVFWLGLCAGPVRGTEVAGVSIGTLGIRRGLLQLVYTTCDWLSTAAILYCFLPDGGGWSYPAFISVFVAGGLLGAISGAPGGIGAFEATVLALSPGAEHLPSTAAALIAYRIIYTFLPLGLAALVLAHDLMRASARATGGAVRRFGAAALDLAPPTFALLAFAGGCALLASVATPHVAGRLHALTLFAPLWLVEASHLLASVVALLLLLVAAGLWRKLEGAYWATLALLGLGALLSLLKGLDFEEALFMGVIALALAPCRPAFIRHSRLTSEPLSLAWLAAIIGAALAAAWLGFFAYRDVGYSDELWWTFLRDADVSRFLRAQAAIAALVVMIAMRTLLGPPRVAWRGEPSSQDIDRAAAIISRAQDIRADAHLALLGDKDLLFSPSGETFLMFRVRGRHFIAMSEPCGRADERKALLWRFAELADRSGATPVFYAVSAALLAEFAEMGLAIRKIGETAVIRLPDFSWEGRSRATLRNTRNKFEKEGASFEALEPLAVPAHLEELKRISDSWLQMHKGAEKEFSLGRFDPSYLARTPVACVRMGGQLVAFANIWPAHSKSAVSIDLMRYAAGAPKGVMDYLFIKLIEWAKAQGYRELDLGMAPLAGLEDHRLAPWFSRAGAAIYSTGEGLYGFKGLRSYKDKFDPEWRPVFLAAPPGAMMPLALLDVGLLTSGGWRGLALKGRKTSSADSPARKK